MATNNSLYNIRSSISFLIVFYYHFVWCLPEMFSPNILNPSDPRVIVFHTWGIPWSKLEKTRIVRESDNSPAAALFSCRKKAKFYRYWVENSKYIKQEQNSGINQGP